MPPPQYQPSPSNRLWPARPAALCLPDPCGLGSDSRGRKVFSGKLLEFLTQTGSELNPVENIWQFMRENWLSNRIFPSYPDILDHCCAAWNKLTDQPWLT